MAASGYTPILLYASGTTTNVPLAANMTSSASGAELAINYADGKLFYKDSGGVVQVLATKGAGTIGGSNTQVQYNSSGALAGSANFTFDGTNIGLAGGTANGVAYLNGSKVLTTGSALVFDGANFGLGVTPSAWGLGTNGHALEFSNAGSMWNYSNTTGINLSQNVYYNGAYYYKSTAAATLYGQGSGQHVWYNAPSGTAGTTFTPTQAMTLDASSNLLVGGTSNAAGARLLSENSSGNQLGLRYTGIATWYNSIDSSGNYIWTKDGSEKARIDTSGNLLVGTTTTPTAKTNSITAYAGFVCRAGVGGATANIFNINWTGSPYLWIDTTNVGQIATVSDYRLKENVTPQKTALDKVMQLQPVEFNRKAVGIFGGSSDIEEGFLAHELQAIIPSAVYGEKDAVTEDGSIQPQSLNWSPVVSVLVKAMQEQQAMITTLQSQVTALQAKVGV